MVLFRIFDRYCIYGLLERPTNNLVGSWDTVLKPVYLKGAWIQRIDILIYKLLNTILKDIRGKIITILLGFQRRQTSLAEKKQEEKCRDISDDIALNCVTRSFKSETQKEIGEEILVKSFSDYNKSYNISLGDDKLISRCNYEYMSTNFVVCKHVYGISGSGSRHQPLY